MEPNLRDTPLRRFNTFWWGLALFLSFAIAAVLVKNAVQDNVIDAETEKGKVRTETYNKIKAEQLKERNSYSDNGDGTVKVKPEDVFGLGKEMGLLQQPSASSMAHGKKFN
ncbi:hypothetical protein [Rubritalea marina]|uniref:hypothetical protein n=1 Tax=Rubritalea marina TaxID=361055 RepID=UPI0003807E08|nr:hypothetical protein [Rubritalea marina]